MGAFLRLEVPFWRYRPRSRRGRLIVTAVAVTMVATWCAWYKPWRAHYLGRPSSYWAERIRTGDRAAPAPFVPTGWAVGRWKWIDDLFQYLTTPGLTIAEIVGDPEFVPVLEDLLDDPDGKVRTIAACQVSAHATNGYRRALPELMRSLAGKADPDLEPWIPAVAAEVATKGRYYPRETRAAAVTAGYAAILERLGRALVDRSFDSGNVVPVLRAITLPMPGGADQNELLDGLPCYFPGEQPLRMRRRPSPAATPGGARLPWTLAVPASGIHPPQSTFDLWVVDAPTVKDVRLVTVMKALDGNTARGGGLAWHYRDPDNYYAVCTDPAEARFTLYKVANGRAAALADCWNVSSPAVETRVLAVQHIGRNIECWLDGVYHLEAADVSVPDAGAVGVLAGAKTQTEFGWLVVTDLRK